MPSTRSCCCANRRSTRRAVRADPVVDAMGGFVDLTIDRLARVEVQPRRLRRSSPAPTPTATRQRAPRTYNQLGRALRPRLHDRAVRQVAAEHRHPGRQRRDDVGDAHVHLLRPRLAPASGYDGFDTAKDWNTGSDLPDRLLLDSNAAIGALGSSESNSGEGHAYIGFNPIDPEKVGSFGGSLQIGGGATEAIAEWLDINGDGLPDKVYRDSDGVGGDLNDVNRNGPIRYRLNTSGPHGVGQPTFGDEKTVTGITKLSTEGNFGLEGAFEAFPGISVAFGLGVEVSWGDAYFSDVNADGLPDYVSGGTGVVQPPRRQRRARHSWQATAPPHPVPIEDAQRRPSPASERPGHPGQVGGATTRWSTPFAGGLRRSPARSRSTPRSR